jgi:purine-binding chemotaxis protein CheW
VSENAILSRIAELETSLFELRRELLVRSEDEHAAVDALTFEVLGKTYAVFLSDIVEVLRMVKWSPLPKAPPEIQGVVNCRGTILPLLNPGILFGEQPLEPTLTMSLVVVNAAGQHIGIIVENVIGVDHFHGHDLGGVRRSGEGNRTLPPFVVGFVKRESNHIAVLDVNRLLEPGDRGALGVALRERDEWGQF